MPRDGIDYGATIISRMDYFNGDVEGEITLRKGATIVVTGYKSDILKAEFGIYIA